jgi:hypothetical protein
VARCDLIAGRDPSFVDVAIDHDALAAPAAFEGDFIASWIINQLPLG